MIRRSRHPLEGALVVAALLVVPLALAKGWTAPVVSQLRPVVVVLVAVGAISWLCVIGRLGRLVAGELRGDVDDGRGDVLGWAAARIAALALVVVPFLSSASSSAGAPGAMAPMATSVAAVAEAAPSTPPGTRVCTVRSGDTLWTLALRELGDPGRWPSIAALNDGRVMADGRRFTDPNVVLPGWQLELPGDDDGVLDIAAPPRDVATTAAGSPDGLDPKGVDWLDEAGIDATAGAMTLLLALAATARRRARARRRLLLDDDAAIDDEVALLSTPPTGGPPIGAIAHSLAAAGRLDGCAHVVLSNGEARLDDGSWRFDPGAPSARVACLAVVLGEARGRTHVVLVPTGATLALAGEAASSLLSDAVRVASALDLGAPTIVPPTDVLRALALRDDGGYVVTTTGVGDAELRTRCVVVDLAATAPFARVTDDAVVLADGRLLVRAALGSGVRALLDGAHDVEVRGIDEAFGEAAAAALEPGPIADVGVVVRLLTAVPRIDGVTTPLVHDRARRAIELLAYLALHKGQAVTGERLRVRVLGTPDADAAAKTLSNVASALRTALGDGPHGPRLPPAGRIGHYTVASDVTCDVAALAERVAWARGCDGDDEKMAWLRSALELIEGEPLSTVLSGYDWFVAEGHLTRLQAVCEDAACELVDLALDRGLVALAALAVERASLVDPYSELLAAAAARVAEARQASLEAMAPAARSTAPSAPAVT